jgi:type VI secretion system secreted protein VgrG
MALASKVRIEIDGKELKNFLYLDIRQKILEHNEFEVVCRLDTLEAVDNFVLDDSKKLIGLTITIAIDPQIPDGTSTQKGFFFKGIITGLQANKSGIAQSDQITLSGYSPDIMMDDKPGSYSFENKTLKQMIDEIMRPYPTDVLKSRINPNSKNQYPYTVQYDESHYDFLKRLASRHGEWLYYDGKELFFGSPAGNNCDLTLGIDLTDFDISVMTNPLDFKYTSYNYIGGEKLAKTSVKMDGTNQLNDLGKYVFDKSSHLYRQQGLTYFSHLNAVGNSTNKELETAAGLEEGASALSMMKMQGSSQNFQLKLGDKINIKAFKKNSAGQVNYGEYIITSLYHTCDHLMNYQNSFQGIASPAKIPPYTDPGAISNAETQSGVITDNNDPDKLGRVRVNMFWQASGMTTPWIRMVNPYAGNERGIFFIPEIGDEVLVGFEGGDAEKPFVIGSYFHGKNKPSTKWNHPKNKFKGITTDSKMQLLFDDDKKIITIETPGGNKVIIDDDKKSISLEDQYKNKVELNSSGITLDSYKDINILAKGEIKLDAKLKAAMHAATEVKVTSLNVELAADVGIKVKGNATAEISAAGQTTVKGAMVMIN